MSGHKSISLIKSLPLLFLLFAIPSITDMYLGLVVWKDRMHIDEGLYYRTAGDYLKGIVELDPSKFLSLPEHPPLAIILLGFLRVLLSPLGLDSPRTAERIFAAICLGAVSLVSYLVAYRHRGKRAGLLAWLLTGMQLIIVPYEFWVNGLLNKAEINGFTLTASLWRSGMAPYCQFATMVLSTMIFVSLSIHFLIDYEKKGNLTRAGICYGIASLMNSAIPATLITICFLWLTYKLGVRRAIAKTFRYGIIGISLLILGNPVLWNLKRLQSSIEVFSAGETAHIANHPYVLLKNQFWGGRFHDIPGGDEPLTVAYLVLIGILLYWVKVYLELWLVQLFLILAIYTAIKSRPVKDERVLFLVWFSVMFGFLSMMMKPSGFVEPHIDYFVPPLGLYCAYTLDERYPCIMATIRSFSVRGQERRGIQGGEGK